MKSRGGAKTRGVEQALDHFWPDNIPEGLSAKERNNTVREWLVAKRLSVPNDMAKAIQRALNARQLRKHKTVPAPAASCGTSRPQTLKFSLKRFPAATNRLPTSSGDKRPRWPKGRRSPITPSARDNGKCPHLSPRCRDLSQGFGEIRCYPARINPRRSRMLRRIRANAQESQRTKRPGRN